VTFYPVDAVSTFLQTLVKLYQITGRHFPKHGNLYHFCCLVLKLWKNSASLTCSWNGNVKNEKQFSQLEFDIANYQTLIVKIVFLF